jgi:hypothetical protein
VQPPTETLPAGPEARQNASATEIIGATEIDLGNEGGKQTGQLGVITDGRVRLLKLPKSVSPTDYWTVAF